MSNEKEIWDLVDVHGKFVRTIQKGEMIPPRMYHHTVEIIPTDRQGHLLVTKRSLYKRRGPGKYEFPAGSVISGESIKDACIRELKEETGLTAKALYPLARPRYVNSTTGAGIIRNIVIAHIEDMTKKEIRLQPGETDDYRILTFDEWMALITTDAFESNRVQMYGNKQGTFFKILREIVGEIPEEEAAAKLEQVQKKKPKFDLAKYRTTTNPLLAREREAKRQQAKRKQ